MDALLISETAVRAWMDAYRAARIERDPDRTAALFTADAHYQERRYKPALSGREAIRNYWRVMVKQQRDLAFSYDLLAVRGSRAFVHWRANFTWLPINGILELDAISQIVFADTPGEHGLLAAAWDEWMDIREG